MKNIIFRITSVAVVFGMAACSQNEEATDPQVGQTITELSVAAENTRSTLGDENWVEHTETFEGVPARVIQHEYDHLDGIVFTDRLSPIKKSLLKRKLNHISAGKFRIDYRYVLPK